MIFLWTFIWKKQCWIVDIKFETCLDSYAQICAALCKLPLCQKSLKDSDGFTALPQTVPWQLRGRFLSIFEDTTWVGSTIYPCDFNRKQSSYWGKGGKTDAFLLLFGEDMGILYTTQKSLRRHKNYKMHREFRRKLPQHLGSLQIAQRWGFSAAADAIFRAGNLPGLRLWRSRERRNAKKLRTWEHGGRPNRMNEQISIRINSND